MFCPRQQIYCVPPTLQSILMLFCPQILSWKKKSTLSTVSYKIVGSKILAICYISCRSYIQIKRNLKKWKCYLHTFWVATVNILGNCMQLINAVLWIACILTWKKHPIKVNKLFHTCWWTVKLCFPKAFLTTRHSRTV